MSKKTKTEIEMTNNIADDGLPAEPTLQVVDPHQLRLLYIAPPGFGKTTFFSAFPDALLLAFEEGHKFVKCRKIVIDKWEGTEEEVVTDSDGEVHMPANIALERILASNRFKFIIIDTVDALAQKCADHFLELYKGQTLGDLGDYGKGYQIGQTDPVRRFINQLMTSGRGLGLTTHEQVVTEKNKKGEVIKTTITSSMPKGVMGNIFKQMDTILHGEFGSVPEGRFHRERIVRTEGTEEFLAKNRGGVFPPAFVAPEDPQAGWKQFEGFLLNPETVKETYNEFLKVYEA